jgi:protein-disulfide isomerase
MHPSPTRHRVALAIALLGMAVSAVAFVVHHRVAAEAGYTSFCNLGGVINCDAVVASRYATLFGVPVAAWGVLAFGVGALLALPGALGGRRTGLADLALLALASGSLGYLLVLVVISAVVIGHLCLLCLATDVVAIAWLLAIAPLAARFEAVPVAGWWRGRSAARAVLAGAAVLAVAGGTWAAVRAPAGALSLAEVQERAPDFYSWYAALPVRESGTLVAPGAHRKGAADAPITIVEFSDFQCPFCGRAAKDLRELVGASPEVTLVFRHFPLDTSCNPNLQRQMHSNACLAAYAAECAGKQGRFWEYHDLLFENGQRLGREALVTYAQRVGVDVAAFTQCLDDPATHARVTADVEAAKQAGVNSTPTLFINGRLVEGALDRAYYDYAVIIERHAPQGGSHDGAG